MFLKITTTLLCASLALAACNGKKDGPPPPPPATPVSLEEVTTNTADYYDEYPATLTALNQVELRAQVSGFIGKVNFQDGQRVSKGQLLYTIDNSSYSANYDQAVANQQLQQANVTLAAKDAKRYHTLDEQDAVAKQLVDKADAALAVSQKQLAAANANIRAVQTNVGFTKIYAPFAGVIGISNVKPGAAVVAGQTLLNTVSQDGELAADFNIDQSDIYRFSKMLNEPYNKSTFSLSFGEGSIYSEPGRLILLDRTVNSQTGNIKARLSFPNPNGTLISGMNATVRVKAIPDATSTLIPFKAVTEQLGEYFVFTPTDSNTVTQVRVIIGKPIGDKVIVKDGLKPGQMIVVEGVQNLKEGSKITTQTAPKQPAAK